MVMPQIIQEELAAVFAAAQRQGIDTVLDVVVPGQGDYLARLDRLLPHVDVFLPNDFEAGASAARGSRSSKRSFSAALGPGRSSSPWAAGACAGAGTANGLRRRDLCGAITSTAAAAATPSTPALSTACCTIWDGPPAACASPAPGRRLHHAVGTTPGVFTPQIERRSWRRIRCESMKSNLLSFSHCAIVSHARENASGISHWRLSICGNQPNRTKMLLTPSATVR